MLERLLVIVAQLVEPLIVVQVVAGSSPVVHPIRSFLRTNHTESNNPEKPEK